MLGLLSLAFSLYRTLHTVTQLLTDSGSLTGIYVNLQHH